MAKQREDRPQKGGQREAPGDEDLSRAIVSELAEKALYQERSSDRHQGSHRVYLMEMTKQGVATVALVYVDESGRFLDPLYGRISSNAYSRVYLGADVSRQRGGKQDQWDTLLTEVYSEGIAREAERKQNLTSHVYTSIVGGRLKDREINAGELQRQALQRQERGEVLLEFRPVFGRDGYVAKRGSTIVSGYHKCGKTEFMQRVVEEWAEDSVLWFSEEPPPVWEVRLSSRPTGCFDHVTLVSAVAMGQDGLLKRIMDGSEDVVVIDTLRTLLGLADERDNSEVANALVPFTAVCAKLGKTFIAIHVDRKGGGEWGEGVSGAGAFIGVVDAVLQVTRDRTKPHTRRIISGLARNFQPEDLMYEKLSDGSLVAVGSPAEVQVPEVKAKVLGVLTNEWFTTKEVWAALPEPRPGLNQVRRAMMELALAEVEGGELEFPEVERQPGVEVTDVQGRTVRWRLCQPTSHDTDVYMGSEVEDVAEEVVEEEKSTSHVTSHDENPTPSSRRPHRASTPAENGASPPHGGTPHHRCFDCDATFPCDCTRPQKPHKCADCAMLLEHLG